MRIVIAAVGRLRNGPERDLVERYVKRSGGLGRGMGFSGPSVGELRPSPASEIARRMDEEAALIAAAIPDGAALAVLDERGDALSSTALADLLVRWRDAGRPAAVFVIGGDDGLAPSLRTRADRTLAFGPATWPHALVRAMLAEQVYRALTILAGHPYHRV